MDALNTSIGGILQIATLCYGFGPLSTAVLVMACSAFFIATWETYQTGTMHLGFINGPTEGLLIAMCSMFTSGYYGPEIWKTPLQEFKTILPVVRGVQQLMENALHWVSQSWLVTEFDEFLAEYGLVSWVDALLNQLNDFLLLDVSQVTLAELVVGIMLVLLITNQIPESVIRGTRGAWKTQKSVLSAYVDTLYFWLLSAGFLLWFFHPSSISKEYGFTMYLAYGIASARICVLGIDLGGYYCEPCHSYALSSHWVLMLLFCVRGLYGSPWLLSNYGSIPFNVAQGTLVGSTFTMGPKSREQEVIELT